MRGLVKEVAIAIISSRLGLDKLRLPIGLIQSVGYLHMLLRPPHHLCIHVCLFQAETVDG